MIDLFNGDIFIVYLPSERAAPGLSGAAESN